MPRGSSTPPIRAVRSSAPDRSPTAAPRGGIVEQRHPLCSDRRHLGGGAHPPLAAAGLSRPGFRFRAGLGGRGPGHGRSGRRGAVIVGAAAVVPAFGWPAAIREPARGTAPGTAAPAGRGPRRSRWPGSPPGGVRAAASPAHADRARRRVRGAGGAKMAAWWVILPPAVMLLSYLLVLRAAVKADAEQRAAAQARRAEAAPGSRPRRRWRRSSPCRPPRPPGLARPPRPPRPPRVGGGRHLRPVRRRQAARGGRLTGR